MKFEITKEQILEFIEWGNSKDQEKLKQWFPEAFETKLEVGRWYKNKDTESIICCESYYLCLTEGLICKGYGVDMFSDWVTDYKICDCIPATDSEVEAALINEAKKRGFKEGVYANNTNICEIGGKWEVKANNFELLNNGLLVTKDNRSVVLSKEGKWAEIIPTMTRQEAEGKLGCKIV